MALRNNFLHSDRLKRDFSEVEKAIIREVDWPCELIFVPSGLPKMRFEWILWSYVSSGRQAMRIDFVPYGRPKMRLRRFPESVISIVLTSLRQIIYLVVGTKFDLDEIEKLTFQVGEWPWELIFCLLEVPKCDYSHRTLVGLDLWISRIAKGDFSGPQHVGNAFIRS
jgi:hypothetical protein